MNGRLGAIYIADQQVGGFLDWQAKLTLTNGADGNDRTHKLRSWTVLSRVHWLFVKLNTDDKVQVRLYADVGFAYWEGTGRVTNQPTTILDTFIRDQVEIIGDGELEAKSEK